MLAAAMAMSMKPHAEPGFFPESLRDKFEFVTEIFWLTARAMELVQKLFQRRDEQVRRGFDLVARAAPGAAAAHAQQCLAALQLGWACSQLGDPAFLGRACYWARFAADWLRHQAQLPGAPARFQRLPAGLVKGMCEVWAQAARAREPEEVLPGLMAADAAVFCMEVRRPSCVPSVLGAHKDALPCARGSRVGARTH
jgi:hypothetical protein